MAFETFLGQRVLALGPNEDTPMPMKIVGGVSLFSWFAVLYLGRLMEIGRAADVFDGPHHPYTEALLSSVPALDGASVPRERIRLSGELPSAANPPSGCVFHTRCPRKIGAVCEQQEPPYVDAANGHRIRCHIPLEELRQLQKAG